MLKRRIFAASLASVLALSSFSVSAFAADESKAYANKTDLKNYVKEMQTFADDELNKYGARSAEKFEDILNYADAVANNSSASEQDVAVAYLMLKEAKERLAIRTPDELKSLVDTYKSIYKTDNILNEDILGADDNIYTDDSWDTFAGAYEDAEAVDSEDSQLITDYYEALAEAKVNLVEKPAVLKRELGAALTELDAKLENEFKYNSWERGTIDGTGTNYDDNTYAWGVLFYHVASIRDTVNTQYESIKSIATVNKTTNSDIVTAYEACKLGIKLLDSFTPIKTGSYSSKDKVIRLFTNTYKDNIILSEDFVEIIKNVAADNLIKWDEDDSACIKADSIVAKDIKDHYKNGKLNVYVDSTNGIKLDSSSHKLAAASGDSDPDLVAKKDTTFDLLTLDELNPLTVVAASAAGKKISDAGDAINNGVFDGVHKTEDGADLEDLSKIENSLSDSTTENAEYKIGGDAVAGYKGGIEASGAKGTWAKIDSSDDIYNSNKAVLPYVDLNTAMTILTSEDSLDDSYVYDDDKKAAMYDNDTTDDRKTAMADIAYSQKFKEVSSDKATGSEWNILGQYIELALRDYYAPEEDEASYTKTQLQTLLRSCDDLILQTGESAMFKARHDDLMTKYNATSTKVASMLKSGDKVKGADAKTYYEDLEDARDALQTELDSFKYTYGDIAEYVAAVAKAIDDKDSAVAGNAELLAKVQEVAYYLSQAADLKATDSDDKDVEVPDLAIDGDTFNYFNRVYTEDETSKLKYDDAEVTLAKSNGGANQSHYDLKTAYEALQTAYESLTSPTTTRHVCTIEDPVFLHGVLFYSSVSGSSQLCHTF